MNLNPMDALGIWCATQPAFAFGYAPGADPAGGIGCFRQAVRAVRSFPLCLSEELLRFQKTNEPLGRMGQRARGKRSSQWAVAGPDAKHDLVIERVAERGPLLERQDRKSTRLNSSHVEISYAVFCL